MRNGKPQPAGSALTKLGLRSLIVVLCLAGAAQPAAAQPAAPSQAPPPAVIVAPVEVKPISNPDIFSGSVEALDAVDLIARVPGYLQSIEFQAGQRVEEGAVLFQIESRPYEVAVAEAKARVAQAEAQLENAEQERNRQQTLSERNVSAMALFESAQARALVAQADVAVAKAQLEQAQIEQGYTTVVAPFGGEIGRSLFSEGALVGPDAGPLARLVRTDPVRVVFSVPDRMLVHVRAHTAQGGTGADPGQLSFRLRLADNTFYAGDGRPEYVASQTDPTTGTVPVRLIFGNPDRVLISGQFVDVVIGPREPPMKPVVPQTAVLQDRDGRYVFVLNDDSTVSPRRVVLGAQVGSGWAVQEGLAGGEKVVVQGLQRLADGMKVQVSEAPAGDGN